jgi:hypothetical protein
VRFVLISGLAAWFDSLTSIHWWLTTFTAGRGLQTGPEQHQQRSGKNIAPYRHTIKTYLASANFILRKNSSAGTLVDYLRLVGLRPLVLT